MIKKTLTILSFVFILFLVSKISFSQTLQFCEGVDENGRAKSPSSTFYIPSGGGYFYFLVRLPYEIQCSAVSYELYEVDDYGYETYNTTIDQTDISKSWVWFWKKVTFYKTGYYHVYVRDCYSYTLTDAYVTIYYK
jgi:hypothetical protein